MTKKKSLYLVLALTMLVSLFSTTAFAEKLDLRGFRTYKGHACMTYFTGTKTPLWNSYKFTGKCGSMYGGTIVPSRITHTDRIRIGGIGSASASFKGVSMTVESGVASKSWTVEKEKYFEGYPSYEAWTGILTISASLTTEAEFMFGSVPVMVITGDNEVMY